MQQTRTRGVFTYTFQWRNQLPLNNDSESDFSLSGDWQRIASLIVAIAYLLVAPILFPSRTWSHFMTDIIIRLLSLAFPLACIWFPDDLAQYFRDGSRFPEITTPSAGRFVRLGGWVLLLLPVWVFLLMNLLDYLYGR